MSILRQSVTQYPAAKSNTLVKIVAILSSHKKPNFQKSCVIHETSPIHQSIYPSQSLEELIQ